MKFEKPIVEIEKFALKDIISASGESASTEPSRTTSLHFDSESYYEDGYCWYNSARDNNPNFDDCI